VIVELGGYHRPLASPSVTFSVQEVSINQEKRPFEGVANPAREERSPVEGT
jgi:hypothetical protein